MFKVIKYEGKARRGKFQCAHGGEVQTPVFMNVGTQAAIKGGVSALDLKELGCQIELSNTPTIFISARATTWCAKWADCISSCTGTARS